MTPQNPSVPALSASILVVDDDEVSRYMAERALASLGHSLVLVETGEEALEWAARRDFAAIVLDIGLPGTSGFEVAQALRRLELNRHTPLLFVTGHAYTEELMDEAYAIGASDLLFKPFNPAVLATKLRVFVDLYLQRQQLALQHQELLARTAALEESRQRLSESREHTERARAERARLHALLAQLPMAITLLRGPLLVVELVNSMACLAWGRSEESMVGQPLLELLPEAFARELSPLLRGVLETGTPYVERERPLRHTGGTAPERSAPVYLDVHFMPLREEGERVNGVLTVASDVTQVVLARQRAEAARAELTAIFESMPDAAYVGDTTGITHANRTALRLLGIERPEQLRVPIAGLAERARVRSSQTGEPIPLEDTGFVRALSGHADAHDILLYDVGRGRDVRMRSAASPVWINGRVAAAVVVHTDVTERHANQEALRRSEEELRTLADSIPQAVWTTSADGTLTYANSALMHYSGLGLRALRDMGLGSLLTEDTRPMGRALLEQRRAQGEPYECELCWRRWDGAERWHLVRVVPLKSSLGQVVRWLGTATDVHDLRQSESEAQRRADFEQQLIGIVSHDLRNPLSAILLGVTTLSRREDLDERSLKAVLRIQSSAARAARMIRDLLDFTQARLGGGLPIQRRRVDLRQMLRAVLDEVEAANPGREVLLRHEGDGQGDWDADRMAQVIQNLVTNALKYSPADTPVRVTATGEQDRVRLEVHNQGEPIVESRLARIFEPLQRATADVDKAGRSVGLGLYIVEQIVRAHGGAVTVRSSAAEGTRFTVTLPRHSGPPVQ